MLADGGCASRRGAVNEVFAPSRAASRSVAYTWPAALKDFTPGVAAGPFLAPRRPLFDARGRARDSLDAFSRGVLGFVLQFTKHIPSD